MYKYDLEIINGINAIKLMPVVKIYTDPGSIRKKYVIKNQSFLAEKNFLLLLSLIVMFLRSVFQDISSKFTKNCEISTIKGKYSGDFDGINGSAMSDIIKTRAHDIRTSFLSLSRLFQLFINLYLILLIFYTEIIAHLLIFWNKIVKINWILVCFSNVREGWFL